MSCSFLTMFIHFEAYNTDSLTTVLWWLHLWLRVENLDLYISFHRWQTSPVWHSCCSWPKVRGSNSPTSFKDLFSSYCASQWIEFAAYLILATNSVLLKEILNLDISCYEVEEGAVIQIFYYNTNNFKFATFVVNNIIIIKKNKLTFLTNKYKHSCI